MKKNYKKIVLYKNYSSELLEQLFDKTCLLITVADLRTSLKQIKLIGKIWIEQTLLPEVLEFIPLVRLLEFDTKLFFMNENKMYFTGLNSYNSNSLENYNRLNTGIMIGDKPFISKDPKMLNVLENARKIAATDSAVLITGETGTGKELIMEWILMNSRRRYKPFVSVNCAAIPHHLMEAEFFGYRKGAFTGALDDSPGKFRTADGGTIFLDEIGDIPLDTQPKLLRVLDYNVVEPLGEVKQIEIDTRVIAATNSDIENMVAKGMFREDLFYRINVFKLVLPPLRHRVMDIPILFKHFMNNYLTFNSYDNLFENHDDVMELLVGFDWPGNIRQLKNLCQNLSVYKWSRKIVIDDIKKILNLDNHVTLSPGKKFKQQLNISEKKMIEEALEICQFHISKTAKYLGMSRTHLHRKIKQYQIRTERSQKLTN